jgi:hypothetical protein
VTANVPPQHLVHGISQCLVLEDCLDVAGRHVAETNGRTVLGQRAPDMAARPLTTGVVVGGDVRGRLQVECMSLSAQDSLADRAVVGAACTARSDPDPRTGKA